MEEQRRKYVKVKLRNGDIKGFSGLNVGVSFSNGWLFVQQDKPTYYREGWDIHEVLSFEEREI